MKKYRIILPAFLVCMTLQGTAQETKDSIVWGSPRKYADERVQIGYHRTQSLSESAASVSTVYNETFNTRSAKNIGNSLFGHGLGLTTLQRTGRYSDYNPTFYIRGLQTLSSDSNPLVLVDGIERDIKDLTPEEVESVSVLKDAAAVALYGYKGIDGVINITTKRGKYNSREIKISYEHGFDWQIRKPKFVDAYTYANAVNEALLNDGYSSPRYSANELEAFKTGEYPYLYPNVDWIGETFRNVGSTNIYNVSFKGGGEKFRYYALGSLNTNQGFVASPNVNDGYSTQDQYSRGNLRTNLDIDLTPNTKMKLNILGVLSESRQPGNGANIWSDMIYRLPAAAFPVRLENNRWGGNTTWSGTMNPVAVSQAAAYTKYHERTLFADMTLDQNLSSILPGMGAVALLSYDNNAVYKEDHSKTFLYGSDVVTGWENGKPVISNTPYVGGKESSMGDGSGVSSFVRRFNMAATLYYDKQLNELHKLYGQLKWDYEYLNYKGVDQTWYRQNVSLYTHYSYKDKLFADLTLMASASNRLAPGHKWAFSPTVALAWVLSNEDFLRKNAAWIDFLKLRASFGVINSDRLPSSNYWEQTYGGGVAYPFDTNYSVGTSSWSLGRLASLSSTHEKAYKYNLGVDATLFGGLNLTFEGYYERRSDIWVSSSGKYSSVLGFTAPYENGGVVDSWGVELGANYMKRLGEVELNVGGNFTFGRNKIIDQQEEPRLYDNLRRTNRPYGQIYGLEALGFFKDQEDIDNSPRQLFGVVKPGDIKYRDVNGDDKIDENDLTAIGYSDRVPEIYCSFHLGAEWRGLGVNAHFQGAENYSAVLNTPSMFYPLINDNTISQKYYDNRWTPDAEVAKYPRLTTQDNANNFRTNTVWLADRSFLKLRSVEMYYKLPKSLLGKTRFIDRAKLYVRGIDLLCFDKIKVADPESYGASYPLTRSVFAGLSVEF